MHKYLKTSVLSSDLDDFKIYALYFYINIYIFFLILFFTTETGVRWISYMVLLPDKQ